MQSETADILLNFPFISVVVTSIVLLCSWWYRKYHNVPPGPLGIPLIGYGPLLGSDPPEKLTKLKKRYGKVMSISFGPQLTIVLNDYEAIKEALIKQGDKFTGRPSTFLYDHLTEKYLDGRVHGLVASNGEEWKETRRFVLQTLRELGMGKHGIQNGILEEAELLCSAFQENIGKPFDPLDLLNASTCNVISTMCFAHRFDLKDAEFNATLKDLQTLALLLAQAGLMQAYPSLRFIPGPMARTWTSWVSTQRNLIKFFQSQIDKVLRARKNDSEGVVPSFVDSFCTEQERLHAAGNQPEISKIFQDVDLRVNVTSLFGAGTETTATTLNWCLLLMLHSPEAQAKVHEELDENVGKEVSVTVDDRAKLPYVEAVIREAQRIGNVVPFGVIRCNTEETHLLGYRIPKNSYVIANYKAVSMDPQLWESPEKFQPERFMNSAGQVEEPPYFMPFAVGKRNCVGESLARMELFLFFSNLMQRFEFRPVSGDVLPPFDKYITGISCRPLPYKVDIRQRK